MQTLRAGDPKPELHTRMLAGSARVLAGHHTTAVAGGWVRAARVCIDRTISYRQWSGACTLHVTLERAFTHADETDRCALDARDRRGAVSFTPAQVERRGTALPGSVFGVEISLDTAMIEDACEQRLGRSWNPTLDTQDAKAFALVEALERELRRDADRLLTDTMLVALARHLGQRHAGAERRRDDAWLHPAAMRRVVERLLAAPADPPSLADLAGLAGLGVSAFLRAFRGSVGVTPAAFAQQARIEQARRIMAVCDLPLAQVSAMTGFSSASHLVRAFRSRFGATPAQWRRSERDGTKSA